MSHLHLHVGMCKSCVASRIPMLVFKLLTWTYSLRGPSCSPYLNLIENIFLSVKAKLLGQHPRDFKKWKEAVRREFPQVGSSDTCQRLLKFMPGRWRQVVQAEGGHIDRNVYTPWLQLGSAIVVAGWAVPHNKTNDIKFRLTHLDS